MLNKYNKQIFGTFLNNKNNNLKEMFFFFMVWYGEKENEERLDNFPGKIKFKKKGLKL